MHTIAYGSAPDQVGDLYLPGLSRAPLVCLFHGGFWRMPHGRDRLHAMALDLSRSGLAVWNLEYRRVGPGGTGWPATLQDVEAAVTHLPEVQRAHPRVDLERLWFVGHSAGGHLAFWAAVQARRRSPFQPPAALGLAPVLDLEAAAAANLGNGAVQAFLGGAPSDVPDRYQAASIPHLLPLDVRQWILHGEEDEAVPLAHTLEYVALARAAGDAITCVPLAGTDHMSLIDPIAEPFRHVRKLLRHQGSTRA